MTYEIGQKVTTPLGVGIIKYYIGGSMVWITFDENMAEIEFDIKHLQPYKTAHEKLIEMGLHLKITKNWAGGIFSHEWWNDNNDRVLVFFVKEKQTTVYEANHDIMRIIPQYLEEMAE
jgi:hypothetical protein